MGKATTTTFHPLDQLSPAELVAASTCVRAFIFENFKTKTSIKYAYVTLIEPPKAQLLAYLGISTSPVTDLTPQSNGILPARRGEVAVIDTLGNHFYVFEVTFHGSDKATVDVYSELEEGQHVGITLEELAEAERIVKADERVQKLCADVGISPHQIVCDGWSIGIDERYPASQRLQQAYMFARLDTFDNVYAHPLDFSCTVDGNAGKVVSIDFAAHRNHATDPFALSGDPKFHDLTKDSLIQSGRERVPPPMEKHNYYPELLIGTKLANGDEFTYRDDIKPLHIVQPEGVSFQLNGNQLTWQNWSLHIGFNYREGLVLNTIQYFDKDEGRVRPVIYRASLSEMVVPYAAPESPWIKKFAFDVGEYGLGMMANELALGCDCLGDIAYLSTSYINHAGAPVELKKVVCIHEEDSGILWKHSDFRTGNKAHVVRGRKLVIQTVVTVANYEYIFAWSLHQDGGIEIETKLTGVLNLYLAAEGEKDTVDGVSFGTMVADRIMAPHHQHIFSLRLDPMIDGQNNSVVETEVLPLEQVLPANSLASKDLDWAGNGFVSKKRTLLTTSEGPRDANASTSRMWSFVNEEKVHHSTKQPVGYRIMCQNLPPLLARPDSFVARRAPFAAHSFWTAPYVDHQIFPAGKYVTQTRVAPEDSLEGWMKGDKNIANTDIVTWISMGVTHIPRSEDFPVMPAAKFSLMLEPVGFFRQNPALDVPSTFDKKSVQVNGLVNGAENGHANGNGGCCH